MADRSQQSLARDAALGDSEALARYLTEQVRTGALAADRLELAAHLGGSLALSLLGQSWTLPRSLQPWAREFGRWGQDACVRVALAGARVGVAIWERKRAWKLKRTVASWAKVDPREALANLEAQVVAGEFPMLEWGALAVDPPAFLRPLALVQWVYASRASSRDTRLLLHGAYPQAEAERLAEELSASGLQSRAEPGPDGQARLSVLREPAYRTPPGQAFADVLGYENGLAKAASCDLQGFNDYDAYTETVFRKLEESKGMKRREVLQRVRDDVVPWALGLGDPVRDRVRARQG